MAIVRDGALYTLYSDGGEVSSAEDTLILEASLPKMEITWGGHFKVRITDI